MQGHAAVVGAGVIGSAWAARFALQQSFLYNPAGMVLFWGITAGGVVGAMRLVRRNPNLWSPSGNVVLATVLGRINQSWMMWDP